MSEHKEGVKDPIRVDAECENAVVEGWPYRGPDWDTIYSVDGEGYLRDDDGDPVPWVGPGVVATDVDPETWGDHYHNPADCPEKDLPTYRPNKHTCDACTVAVGAEHSRDHYRPEHEEYDGTPEGFREELQDALSGLGRPEVSEHIMVSKRMHEKLKEHTAPAREGR